MMNQLRPLLAILIPFTSCNQEPSKPVEVDELFSIDKEATLLNLQFATGIYVDLGFLGIQNDYQPDRLFIPHKKPRRKSKNDPIIELNDQQKTYNKQVSKIRIRVEHAIGGLKR